MMEELDDNEGESTFRPTGFVRSAVIKKGILSKKGMGKLIRPWVLRTVVLDSNHRLQYYEGKIVKGDISLDGTIVREVTSDYADGRQFAFEIANISGVKKHQISSLILAAGSRAEADEWIECIAKASGIIKQDTGYVTLDVRIFKSNHGD